MNDNSLQTEGYKLVRADNPNDIKIGEVAFTIENVVLLGLLVYLFERSGTFSSGPKQQKAICISSLLITQSK